MDKRILIGACGGLTGSYLTRQFKHKGLYVIGADANQLNVTRYFTDEFVMLPSADSSDFLSQLIKILKEKNISYYVPTHSGEIRVISKFEEQLRANWSGAFTVCPYETFKKLDDKYAANESLRKIGIPVPELITNNSAMISYPIFMKPNKGSGSRNVQIIENDILHHEYCKLYPSANFYQFIDGTEFTVDCMYDETGTLLGYNQRIRIKSMGGAVIVTQNNYEFDIFPYLKKISEAFTFKGCVNFQYILSDNIPYFIDVNLRYASGGLPLTVASGIDVPQMLLDIWEGKKIKPNLKNLHDKKIMYRYFEELFEDK